MIHSLAGGDVRRQEFNDFAKVKLLEGFDAGSCYWYITRLPLLNEGDVVIVPFGRNDVRTKGEVVRIDKNVSSMSSPVSPKYAKEILSLYIEEEM